MTTYCSRIKQQQESFVISFADENFHLVYVIFELKNINVQTIVYITLYNSLLEKKIQVNIRPKKVAFSSSSYKRKLRKPQICQKFEKNLQD